VTIHSRVHVIRPDGTQGIENRQTVNCPAQENDEQAEAFLRSEWAKYLPHEKYPEGGIEIISPDDGRARPGQVPFQGFETL
jgi:hypothetical protein